MGDGGAGDDDEIDREAILRRRSRFVLLAVAALASMGGECVCQPQPCLEPVYDAGPDSGTDGGDGDGG